LTPWYGRKKRGRSTRVSKLSSGIFDSIIGYNDVKELFRKSILSKKQTHILLIGPPASAKSLFLLECDKIKNSYYILGGTTSKAGMAGMLFDIRPNYLLVDELEKMKWSDYSVLLTLWRVV